MRKLLIPALIFILLGSCNKTLPVYVIKKPVEELLIGKTWRIEKIIFAADNKLYRYKRNASDNDVNHYVNDVITFKGDNTGIYSNDGTHQYNISWQFTNTDKSDLKYTIYDYDKGYPNPGTNLVVTYENVVVTDSTFRYAEFYTNTDAKSVMSSAIRTPMVTGKP